MWKDAFSEKVGRVALAKKSNWLVALSIDYPDFRYIPMYLLDRTRKEMRKAGIKYAIYYYGPRTTYGGMRAPKTLLRDATAFKIYFTNISGLLP